jgi:hypothetical protein
MFNNIIALSSNNKNILIISPTSNNDHEIKGSISKLTDKDHITSLYLYDEYLYIGTHLGFLQIWHINEYRHTHITDIKHDGPISSIAIDAKNKLLIIQHKTHHENGYIQSSSIFAYPLPNNLHQSFVEHKETCNHISEQYHSEIEQKNSPLILYPLLNEYKFFLLIHPDCKVLADNIQEAIQKNISSLHLDASTPLELINSYLKTMKSYVGIDFQDTNSKPEENTLLTEFNKKLYSTIKNAAFIYAQKKITDQNEFKNLLNEYPLLKKSSTYMVEEIESSQSSIKKSTTEQLTNQPKPINTKPTWSPAQIFTACFVGISSFSCLLYYISSLIYKFSIT